MNRRIAVRAIIVKNGKLFCVKLKPYASSITGQYWCTVGGGLDSTEGLIDCLRREVKEEIGVEPVVGQLLYVQQFASKTTEHIEFFFHVTNADDFDTIDLSKTSHGEAEIAEYGFIDASTNVVFPKFLQKESFTDIGLQPTKFYNYL